MFGKVVFLYLFFFFLFELSHSSHTYGNQSHSVRYSTIIKDENETQTRKMMIFHHVHTRSFLFGNQTQFIFFFFFFRFDSFLHHLFTVYSFVVRPRIYRKFEFSIAYRLWVCLRIKRSFISIEFNWIEFNSIYMQRFISSHVLLVSSSFSLLFYFIFFTFVLILNENHILYINFYASFWADDDLSYWLFCHISSIIEYI